VLAASSQGTYDVLVAFHVVAAVVGFGSVAISGVYGASARRLSARTDDELRARTRYGQERPERVEEIRRYFRGRSLAEYLIVIAPFFGAAALASRPGHHGFGSLWVVAGEIIWVVASALLLLVVRPAEGAIRRAAGAGDLDAARAPGRRLMWASVVTDVLFVIALAFMVTQPR